MVDIDHGRFDRVSRKGGIHARAFVAELCQAMGFDPSGLCAALVMTGTKYAGWQPIRSSRSAPIPAVTSRWRSLCGWKRVTRAQSLERIEGELGVPCRHLSYPYGDECSAGEQSEFGMRTGVTTRKGLIQRRHASALTALPRVSLNGDHQHPRYVKVFLNAAPFAFANRRQRQAAQTAPFH
jgi:hypothetical protein